MTQIGQVEKATGNQATVLVRRASACGENCAHCKGACTPTAHRARVDNPIGAKKGDLVKIETPDGVVLRSAILVYIVPIAVMFAAFALVYTLTANGDFGILAAFLGLAAGFFGLRAIDRRIAPKPVITHIIGKEGEESHGA